MSEELIESSLAKQVAILVLSQDSERTIATKLKLTHPQVKAIKKSEEYEAAIKELAEEQTRTLLYQWKKRLEAADSHAWAAFMHNLKDKKSMEAVKEYLNMIGFRAKQEDKATDGPAINLIMPGAPTEKIVTIVQEGEKK